MKYTRAHLGRIGKMPFWFPATLTIFGFVVKLGWKRKYHDYDYEKQEYKK